MGSSIKYIASSFAWSTIAKVLNAALKFASIPLLLKYFGKESYGLITLAVATNAYMQMLNMGINTGAVKFLSQWIFTKDFERIDRVVRTNLTLYILIGLINAAVLLLLIWNGQHFFALSVREFETFKSLLYILAVVSIGNWTTFVFYQLLVADEKIAFTQKVMTIRNIMSLVIVLITIQFKWTIFQYFFYDSIVNMLIIIPYFLMVRHRKLVRSLVPAFYWEDFSVVFKYSLAIFAMGFFQFTATHSRPLILGIFASGNVTSILADYRIIEVFPVFIISIGGTLISILLPKTSKAIQQNNQIAIEKIAYTGTKYTSILVCVLCFPIIINSGDLLSLYVGEEYRNLAIWLSLWVFSLTFFLHNAPVSSLVLGTGKTKMLVYSSIIACVLSIVVNAMLTNRFAVGSAIIGYLLYIVIQMSFYYLYFNEKVLGLNSIKVFKCFAIPTFLGGLCAYVASNIGLEFENIIVAIIIKSLVWIVLYVVSILSFKVIDFRLLLKRFSKTHKVDKGIMATKKYEKDIF